MIEIMRRVFYFICTVALISSFRGSAQTLPERWTTHVIAEFYGFKDPMVFSTKVEKPGMSAIEIYNTIIARKSISKWLRENLGQSINSFGLNEIESTFRVMHLGKKFFYYTFYIDAHDGYYTVHLTDIHCSPPELYVCGTNGLVFRDQYTPHKYNLAVKMAEIASKDFVVICRNIEQESFGLSLTED